MNPNEIPSDGRRRNNLTAEQRSAIGRKGGKATAHDSAHMAEIGRKGGLVVSADRAFMREIGRKGGKAGTRESKLAVSAEDLKP